jgi:cold shock CspA family protein
MAQGTATWFHGENGFGFITPDDGSNCAQAAGRSMPVRG